MNHQFKGWGCVAKTLRRYAAKEARVERSGGQGTARLNGGQRASLLAIAKRISGNGIIIADEVGMGKTRIAVELTRAVVECGGRVAILIPPGLGFQWQDELSSGNVDAPEVLRGIPGYFDAWQSDGSTKGCPWFDKEVVVISHSFPNWQVKKSVKHGDAVNPLRWALLPELLAQRQKCNFGKYPHGYHELDLSSGMIVAQAAESILEAIGNNKKHVAARTLDQMLGSARAAPWKRLLDQDGYVSTGQWREWFEKAIGIGFGAFDLVIIDEAHKSRGASSGLTTLLENMLLQEAHGRRFAMTATPVELDVNQWWQALRRIGVGEQELRFAQADKDNPIASYAAAVKRLRINWQHSAEVRKDFARAASAFQACLCRYLLRRDKREDASVIQFKQHSGLAFNDYRDTGHPITVNGHSLSQKWQRAVCAAEALSVLTKLSEDAQAKRLRLTLASGHGISSFLSRPGIEDEVNPAEQPTSAGCNQATVSQDAGDRKRQERVAWWRGIVEGVCDEHAHALLDHPAILAAVDAIEDAVRKGEKVLVFGRFTEPMRMLTELLNAREMLRRLNKGAPWPQEKVHEGRPGEHGHDAWRVVRAAHAQLSKGLALDPFNKKQIAHSIKKQYGKLEYRRGVFRDQLMALLEQGFDQLIKDARDEETDASVATLERFANARHLFADTKDLIALSRALFHLLTPLSPQGKGRYEPTEVARQFMKIVQAAGDRDHPDAHLHHDLDSTKENAKARKKKNGYWNAVKERIRQEYAGPEGGFARLMYGKTTLPARRMMQLSFNRPESFPQVLVAQSLVGREGLNLHEACRTVVLLHPEWNPGVVEQQIGRVDRVNSHWSRQLEAAIKFCKVHTGKSASVTCDKKHAAPLPRIDVRPVIFSGTYDEFNWSVLRERWDDLRAQLHGVIIPPSEQLKDPQSHTLITQLEAMAPNFSPSISQRCSGVKVKSSDTVD